MAIFIFLSRNTVLLAGRRGNYGLYGKAVLRVHRLSDWKNQVGNHDRELRSRRVEFSHSPRVCLIFPWRSSAVHGPLCEQSIVSPLWQSALDSWNAPITYT